MVADFGIARAVSVAGGEKITATGVAVGTPEYMSPEQASGRGELDGRSDVYALGCVLYEMLAGQPPFNGPNVASVIQQHLTAPPPSITHSRSAVTAPVSEAIVRALSKTPADRFASAGDLARALTATGIPITDMLHRRPTVALVAVATVLALSVAVLLCSRRVEHDPRKSLIVFPFRNQTGSVEHKWLEEASANLLSLSLAHWEDLRVYDDERTKSLMRQRHILSPTGLDFEAARAMAREARVGTLALGDIGRQNGDWVIQAKVYDVASGERIAAETVRGAGLDPRGLFDTLATHLLHLSGAPPGIRPDAVAQTTRSLEAYRDYLQGTNAIFRRQHDSAAVTLRRAVQVDSTFALAYMRLSQNESWRERGGDPTLRQQFSAMAQTHSGALPLRFRLLIQAQAAYDHAQWRRVRGIAGQLINMDSTDAEAWNELGESHFHHQAGAFPHPDTLGNLGKALSAFKRSRALDSTFIAPYGHIVDALMLCAAAVHYVCLADSAEYGEPGDLTARYGARRIERLRQAAGDEAVATAYAWATTVPEGRLVRQRLVTTLLAQHRYQEAQAEAARYAALGDTAAAWALESQSLLGQHRFREAAGRMRQALAMATDSQVSAGFRPAYEPAGIVLGSSGHLREGLSAYRRVWRLWHPVTEPFWLGTDGRQFRFSKQRMGPFLEDVLLLSHFGVDSAQVVLAANKALDTLQSVFDSGTFRGAVGRLSNFFAACLVSRDTTLLKRWLSASDTVPWPSATAQLAYARGDTQQARRLLDQHYRVDAPLGNGPVRPTVSEHVPEAFAWADLLARMGDYRRATEAYARLDSAPYDVSFAGPANFWGLLIRSYAERGALYQRLGDRARAAEMYQKFIDAWGEGDETVQPLVERARRAVASLRNQPSAGPVR